MSSGTKQVRARQIRGMETKHLVLEYNGIIYIDSSALEELVVLGFTNGTVRVISVIPHNDAFRFIAHVAWWMPCRSPRVRVLCDIASGFSLF